MADECYRCGAELGGRRDALCCPNCGSPQLSIASTMMAEAEDGSTTGELPPPKPRMIEWKMALRCGMQVTAGTVVLFVVATYVPVLTLASLLWILFSPFLATALYRKKLPERRMDGGVGARIGLAVGLMMAASLATVLSGVGLIARYVQHSMGAFDAEVGQRMREQIQRSVAANPVPANVLQQMLSAEFRTGVMLLALLMLLGCLLFFSTVSGAFAGMVGMGRRREAR